jgi:hypothetical protein
MNSWSPLASGPAAALSGITGAAYTFVASGGAVAGGSAFSVIYSATGDGGAVVGGLSSYNIFYGDPTKMPRVPVNCQFSRVTVTKSFQRVEV